MTEIGFELGFRLGLGLGLGFGLESGKARSKSKGKCLPVYYVGYLSGELLHVLFVLEVFGTPIGNRINLRSVLGLRNGL